MMTDRLHPLCAWCCKHCSVLDRQSWAAVHAGQLAEHAGQCDEHAVLSRVPDLAWLLSQSEISRQATIFLACCLLDSMPA